MEKLDKRSSRRVEDLDMDGVVTLLERWNMMDYVEFVRKKQLDGRKLLDVSEGIVKLWRPKANAKVFMNFIKDLKENPEKYVEIPSIDHDNDGCNIKDKNLNVDTAKSEEKHIVTTQAMESNDNIDDNENKSTDIKLDIESQYQTVTVRKKVQNTSATSHNTISSVEELIRKLVPAKSFLYRNQQKAQGAPSYLPMDAGTPKKSRKFFRLSSYEYPFFDIKSKFSRQESNNDRGYYSMKRNSRYYIQKIYRRPEAKPKYKSISTTDELNVRYPEDHFYEDLNYIDIDKVANESKPEPSKEIETAVVSVKPCIVKIQELFQSFKVPFFRKHEMLTEKEEKKEVESDSHIYENSDSVTASHMYDSVRVDKSSEGSEDKNLTKLPVEDYLEPVQVGREYCDVDYSKQRDDSLLGYIMSIFESTFGFRRETNVANDSDSSETGSVRDECLQPDDARKWPDKNRTNMADRPLPVPVENESFYMNIDRAEAENLLKGQPDGSFVLRPSSQPNHAYTLTVSCAGAVHNVGVRRRPDGRLALGFARRGERSFTSVTSLLRHHRKRRLLLVAGGGVIGGTTLNETPHYYQTPSSIPILNTATNS